MISIILVNPQIGENIGAAARAMQNFAVSDLRLVNPRDGWPNENAEKMSSGALDKISEVKLFNSLADSIQDLHFTFATTSRTRDMVKPCYSPELAMREAKKRISDDQKVGIIFGPERTGLENDDIAKSQALISIPVNPDFYSLNLAQSVLLICYEWMKLHSNCEIDAVLDTGDSFPAEQKEIQSFITRLNQDLENRNFFRSEGLKPTMLRNIENIFTRADITDQELRTLHGILSALRGNKSPK